MQLEHRDTTLYSRGQGELIFNYYWTITRQQLMTSNGTNENMQGRILSTQARIRHSRVPNANPADF